jgi:hypothetical protein
VYVSLSVYEKREDKTVKEKPERRKRVTRRMIEREAKETRCVIVN